jgi:DNA (cytosine-5)-methyltransferase 1
MKKLDSALTAIDLFCGAGGLTLGLKHAGFNVVAGVEVNPEIAKTYKANHPTTKLLIRDVREIKGKDFLDLTGLKEIDLVAGCPPCQGFSKLTDKYHRKDPRNDLVLEMARLIEEIASKMVMMENVSGLAGRGKPVLDEFMKKVKKLGYVINEDILQMADYGIPQSRKRLVLLAGKGFEISLPEPSHCRIGDVNKGLKHWLTLADVIKNMPKPVTLSHAKERGGPKKFDWHIVSDLKEISIQRLKALDAGDSRGSLPKELRPKCHVKSNKGFQNVYGRLSWEQTPPTITSGFTRTCMGRFGHPEELRTISVREAALIQTFPMNYEFDTEFLNTACDLVDNALPYVFARKVAKTCLESWRENESDKLSIRPRILGGIFHGRI